MFVGASMEWRPVLALKSIATATFLRQLSTEKDAEEKGLKRENV